MLWVKSGGILPGARGVPEIVMVWDIPDAYGTRDIRQQSLKSEKERRESQSERLKKGAKRASPLRCCRRWIYGVCPTPSTRVGLIRGSTVSLSRAGACRWTGRRAAAPAEFFYSLDSVSGFQDLGDFAERCSVPGARAHTTSQLRRILAQEKAQEPPTSESALSKWLN